MFLDYGTMATNIVRWMKTKISGYKPITVMPSGLGFSYASDTELLLSPSTLVINENASQKQSNSSCRYHRHHESYCSEKTNCVQTPMEKNKSKLMGKRHLNLEELECDVSVEGCDLDQGGGLRQEFSFTLYDLDGHGKITKDDIAGLVKTIYETLGQSVRVPHYGSKTIKVKLTISPEKKVCKESDEASSPTLPKANELSGDTPKDKWSKYHFSKKKDQRRCRQEQNFCRRRHSISSSGLSEDREADVSEDDDEVPFNNELHNPALRGSGATTVFSKLKRRSSSLHRRELFQIIQENMEKNNLCFQTSRKPVTRHASYSSPYRDETKVAELFGKKSVNNWDSSAQPEKCDSGKMFLNSFDVKNNTGGSPRRVHQRSHSYDLSANHCTVNEEVTVKKKHPTSHELKHRYRAFEQARAKEQVVRWLEQEFSSPTKYCNNRKKNNNLNHCKTSKEEKKSKVRSCSNEKREHHHIHKHVHHHYHHYHESPILV